MLFWANRPSGNWVWRSSLHRCKLSGSCSLQHHVGSSDGYHRGMSRVIFMCGPAGSGKSTVARRLQADGWERLSFDEEAWRLGIRSMPLPPHLLEQIEAALQFRLLELVRSGADVVLDFSFWSRKMREDYRSILRPQGVEPETIYLATPREIALARVQARVAGDSDSFVLSPELAAEYFDHFQVPVAAEGPLTVVEPAETPPRQARL